MSEGGKLAHSVAETITEEGARMTSRRLLLIIARFSLASSFLSAVADRFGLWGAPGTRYAAWGDWPHFLANVATLNWFLPVSWVPLLGWCSTVAETAVGVLLLAGYQLKWAAYSSAALLSLFALTMTTANGVKAPLDYSVFSAASLALLIGSSVPQKTGPHAV